MNTSILGQVEPLQDDDTSLTRTRDSYRPEAQLPVGTCLQGKYDVTGVLGHGGFAVVYDAEHVGLGRRVAIKVLHIGADTPQTLVERFRREARISALVHHPNVLEVYDTGQLTDGSPFLVMERVNGENLSTLIRRERVSIATAVELGRQLALGLAAIADAGIVHRDVKPDNIMLHDVGDGMPTVKLVDFGISKHVSIEPSARLTCHGALVGTPQYMSPEQIRGEDVDARSDIYAAGAVLYEALAGSAPHQSESFSELVVAVLNNQVQPLSQLRANCPPELEQIILTALARKREDRHASPRQLLEALDELACAYDLPRGPDAFRATDREDLLRSSTMRRSSPGTRALWGYQWRDLKRPLQAAAVALLAVGSPRLFGGAAAVATTNASKLAPVAALVPSVMSVQSATAAMAPISGQLLNTAALAEPTDQAGLAASPSLLAPAILALPRAPDAATTSLARKRKPVTDKHARGLVAASGRAQPESVAVTPTLESGQRQSWEQTMQTGLSAMVRGQLSTAKHAYAEAVRIAPREAAGFRGLGLVSARLGETQAAKVALKRYLTLAPDADDAAVIQARIAALGG